ncbi:hypothetical protein EOA75_03875 [Mesorhizobium sp. M1A.F.Ca.IN.022.07.1.1]|uniref:hypothetical protein n=1 Tax=Mesorhizobium sp. M1A.F.Ca.IN.022.07.1.1 TaxID=2496767 RepID=UPI000FCC2191|nr:hypothetical protein [Mesorhizobium sp. M1A.F.Ca.IN.022.07.1.1]RUV97353.1 hypothetical protein EOA75_03875 [Mesorhizobium sp. M1A.F.Ca.IN.022.07.1.1]TIS70234.1 MAG: hypothetical protein E5X11_05320 [Mesorhizobium sp.]
MKPAGYYLAPGAFVLVLAGATGASAAEQPIACKKVPLVVRDMFHKDFPVAKVKACAREVENGELVFEIASVEGAMTRDVLYHQDGKVIVVEESIPMEAVPQSVRAAVDTKFAGGKIKLAEKLMRDGKVSYEFQISYKGKNVQPVFDPDGKEVKG